MNIQFAFRMLPALALVPLPLAPLLAQQESAEPVIESRIESSMVIASADESGEMAEVQVFSSSGDGMPMVFGGGMLPPPDVFSLANNSSVQREIELVDEQLEQIREINRDFSARISGQIGELTRGGMSPEKGRDLSALIQDLNEQKKAKMESVLLPHQFDRLRQIALQTQMKRSGDAATLSSDQLVEALGISAEQQEQIQNKAEQLKQDMEKRIAEMKQQAREELLGELTREQRAKLKEMMGNDFDLKTPDFRERVRRVRGSLEPAGESGQ